MADTTVLVKFPGQPLCYMKVPTDKIDTVHESIMGLQRAAVQINSLYRGFYYLLMDRERTKKRLPFNMTVAFVESSGRTDLVDIAGPFAICKLPKGLTGRMADITQEDAAQLSKLFQT